MKIPPVTRARQEELAEFLHLLAVVRDRFVQGAAQMRERLADDGWRDEQDHSLLSAALRREPRAEDWRAFGGAWYLQSLASWVTTAGDLLAALRVAMRRQQHQTRREDTPRPEVPLLHPALVPAPAALPVPDAPLVALLCAPLTPSEQAVLRAHYQLYRRDPAHDPSWADVGQVAGVKSAASAKTLASRARAKLRARYGTADF